MEPYQVVLQELLKVPESYTAGEDEIRMHCPVCNHPKSKLYVGIHRGLLPRKVLVYDCKHCNFQGSVSPRFMKQFGLEPITDYFKSIKKISHSIYKVVNPVTGLTKNDFKIPDNILPEDEKKLKYLKSRFGRMFDINDIKKYKFVLNFKNFCEFNKIDPFKLLETNDPDKLEFYKKVFNEFTNNFVGILSFDNNKINFRNIDSEFLKTKRYMMHSLDKHIINPYMYIPDIPFDIMCKHATINMTEGAYDIIGVKELYYPNDDYSNVFVAVGSRNSYTRSLMQIMKMTCFLNAKLNIFADNDIDLRVGEENVCITWYKDMFKKFYNLPNMIDSYQPLHNKPIFSSITLNFNTAVDANGKPYKDFGNITNPIKLEKYEI